MKPKKIAAKLARRRAAWAALETRLMEKARSRYRAGGYREPGALK